MKKEGGFIHFLGAGIFILSIALLLSILFPFLSAIAEKQAAETHANSIITTEKTITGQVILKSYQNKTNPVMLLALLIPIIAIIIFLVFFIRRKYQNIKTEF